jgi:hypothetical protein
MATVARRVAWLLSAALFWTVSLSSSKAFAYYIFPDGFAEVRTSAVDYSDTNPSPLHPATCEAIQGHRASGLVPSETSSTPSLSHFALAACDVVIEGAPAARLLLVYLHPHTCPVPKCLEHPPKRFGAIV